MEKEEREKEVSGSKILLTCCFFFSSFSVAFFNYTRFLITKHRSDTERERGKKKREKQREKQRERERKKRETEMKKTRNIFLSDFNFHISIFCLFVTSFFSSSFFLSFLS